jgi:hypothetical protein
MGASQRRKGATAEREVAAILTDALGFVVKRQLGQARDGGDDIRVGRWRLEVKRRETLAMDAWSAQVEACAEAGERPAVIYRRSGQPWRISMLLADFIPLLREDIQE